MSGAWIGWRQLAGGEDRGADVAKQPSRWLDRFAVDPVMDSNLSKCRRCGRVRGPTPEGHCAAAGGDGELWQRGFVTTAGGMLVHGRWWQIGEASRAQGAWLRPSGDHRGPCPPNVAPAAPTSVRRRPGPVGIGLDDPVDDLRRTTGRRRLVTVGASNARNPVTGVPRGGRRGRGVGQQVARAAGSHRMVDQ